MSRKPSGRAFATVAAALLMLQSNVAVAFDWSVSGRVTVLEPSYMPGWISFQIDTSVGSCPAGAWLTWNAQGADQASKIANSQAVYATLLTAKASGRSVTLFGANSGCVIEHIHFHG